MHNYTGYHSLLSIPKNRKHYTIFCFDYPFGKDEISVIQSSFPEKHSKAIFLRVNDSADKILNNIRLLGVNLEEDYCSIQTFLHHHSSFPISLALTKRLRYHDYARLELPMKEMGFFRYQVIELLKIIKYTDYKQQQVISEWFFKLLEKQSPYNVEIKSGYTSQLIVEDSKPWFELCGPLLKGEQRILPSGEVAYTGLNVSGNFFINGAVLASPQSPEASPLAKVLNNLSKSLLTKPIELSIRNGKITCVKGSSRLAKILKQLTLHPNYESLVEVGISFNESCEQFIYDWPAASNECVPGAHIAIGGSPEKNSTITNKKRLVHIDLMSRCVDIKINGKVFMLKNRLNMQDLVQFNPRIVSKSDEIGSLQNAVY